MGGGTKTYCRDRFNVFDSYLCPGHWAAKVCRVGKSKGVSHFTMSIATGYDDTGTANNTILTTLKEENTQSCNTSTNLYDGSPLGISIPSTEENVCS